MQIIVRHDDGTETEITEGVQIAYDIAYGSMDWGSGFLDLEEMEAVARLAEACRFPSFSKALESVQDARREQERQQALRDKEARRRAEETARRVAERQALTESHRLIAADMRAKEPLLAAAGWPDEDLVRLHALREARKA